MLLSKVEDSSAQMQKRVSRCKIFENTFCNNSSIHGVNKIGRATSAVRKFFWILILMLCFVGCLFQAIEFISMYLRYSVVVNLESNKAEFLEFPAVTLCNVNSIRKEFQSCVERKLSYDECLNFSQKEATDINDQNISTPLCKAETKRNFVEKNRRPWLDVIALDYASRLKYGHQVDDFIKSCIINKKVCNPADFKNSLSYNYGNCFTYVPAKEEMRSLFPGPASGLELEINLETPKYATYTDAVGAKMQLHDPRVRHNVDEESIVVSPGTKTYVAVTKTIISRLPPPYEDRCKDYGDEDSQDNCVGDCLHNIISTKCFCSLGNDPNDSVPQCDIRDPTVSCCLTENYADKDCDCPLPCKENIYNIQVSTAVWPIRVPKNGGEIDCVETNETKYILHCKRLRETHLILKIFWNTFEYTEYKQQPTFQVSEVFSQIGGLLSLWLGVSLVAVFEALENIILLCKGI